MLAFSAHNLMTHYIFCESITNDFRVTDSNSRINARVVETFKDITYTGSSLGAFGSGALNKCMWS